MTTRATSKSRARKQLENIYGGSLSLGALIASIRKGEGWSLAEMAKRLKVTRAHIAAIERGSLWLRRPPPNTPRSWVTARSSSFGSPFRMRSIAPGFRTKWKSVFPPSKRSLFVRANYGQRWWALRQALVASPGVIVRPSPMSEADFRRARAL